MRWDQIGWPSTAHFLRSVRFGRVFVVSKSNVAGKIGLKCILRQPPRLLVTLDSFPSLPLFFSPSLCLWGPCRAGLVVGAGPALAGR